MTSDLDAIVKDNEELRQKEIALQHAIADLTATFNKVETERDRYRAALEQYADIHYWNGLHDDRPNQDRDWWIAEGNGYDLARAALQEMTK